MDQMNEWIREYRILMDKEKEMEKKKAYLRSLILKNMEERKAKVFRCEHGVARINERFKLIPKMDEVLQLLSVNDLFLFAQFTATKVKEWLVPKYGREKLLPLFLVEKSSCLQIFAQDKEKDCLSYLESGNLTKD